MDGLDIEPIEQITRSFWHHNFHMYDDAMEDNRHAYFAVMSWGDVNDRSLLENQEVMNNIVFFLPSAFTAFYKQKYIY